MKSEKNNSGWILIAVALFLVVLCGFAALAIDVGGFYSVRTSAQRAADSGALAGALTFVTSCQACAINDSKRTTIAEQHATGVAKANKIMGIPIASVTAKATVTTVPNNAFVGQVTVTVTHPAPIFFAAVLGFASPAISATATAEAGANAVASQCVKPLFLPNDIHDKNPCTACGSPNPTVLVDGSGNVPSTAYADISSFHTLNMKSATESLIRDPLQSATKQNMFGITFPNDVQQASGTYGSNLSTCPDGAKIVCNTSYATKSDSGLNLPTQTQLKNLVDANGGADIYSGVGKYKGTAGTISNTSHQLIVIPIFDVCSIPNFCDLDPGPPPFKKAKLLNPAQKIKVGGFARVFADVYQGEIRLWLDGIVGCGNYKPDPVNNPTGPYGIPVRLVHN